MRTQTTIWRVARGDTRLGETGTGVGDGGWKGGGKKSILDGRKNKRNKR